MMTNDSEVLARTISRVCGWLYFLAWSISFWPQALLNLRRRTTQGFLPDFPLLNVIGFACYTISTAVFLYSPVVRSEYAARHPLSPEPTVRFNDLAFGVHALVMCFVVYSQFWPRLWGWEKASSVRRHANKVTLGLASGSLLAVVIVLILVAARQGHGEHDGTAWGWLDVVYSIQYVKLLLTIFKYIPQVIANYRRKSTIGWSIAQQLLDFSGGVLSLLQLIIDSALQADWSGLTGNPVKFGLANVSMIFDIIFITQHYLLYGPVAEERMEDGDGIFVDPAQGPRSEREPLLS